MSLTYAGVPLLLEDPEGRASRWIRRHLDPRQVSLFGNEPAAYSCLRHVGRSIDGNRVALSRPNYPDRPDLKVGQLYWPTGATRWACGLFLVDDQQLADIRSVVVTQEGSEVTVGPEYLELRNGGSRTEAIFCQMRMLTPRPVSAQGADNRLYLLPLVDERYFWQWRHVEAFRPGSWAEALALVAVAIGKAIITSGIPESYGRPDPELQRDCENAAVLLEAIAANLGRRVVVDLDGDISLQQADDAESQYVTNLATLTPETAGGAMDGRLRHGEATVPQAVAIATQDGLAPTRLTRGATTVRSTVGGLPAGFVPGTTRTVFDRPTLFEEIDADRALADQIAIDQYLWLWRRQFDVTLNSVCPWAPTGYDDAAIWTYGLRDRRGRYRTSTRLASLPPDVYACTAAHLV